MIAISFIHIGIISIIVWTIYRVIQNKKKKGLNILREVVISLTVVYFLAIIYFTIFKYGYVNIALEYDKYRMDLNLIPFKETIRTLMNSHVPIKMPIYNIIGNIVLFIPLGFLIPLLFEKYNKLFKIGLIGFLTSLLIEFIQLSTAFNITDIDDIIFNTSGAILGLFCYRIFMNIVKSTKFNEKIENIKDYECINIHLKILRPISAIMICSIGLFIYCVYDQTYSENLSNNEMAKEAFANRYMGNVVASKDFEKYKFFLIKNEDFLEVAVLKKVLDNRYTYENTYQIEFNTVDGYRIEILEDFNSNKKSVLVFGRNSEADSILIKLSGKEYKEQLNHNEYFITSFPTFENLPDKTDIYNIYENKDINDLQVSFLGKEEKQYKSITFLK